MIILFEAKISLSNEKTIQKAELQLQHQREYFHKHHGHILTPDWKIVSVIACKILPQSPPCSKCKFFLLGTSCLSNLKDWWQQLASKLNALRNAETTQENRQEGENHYKRLVGRVVGFSTACIHFVSNLSKYRDEIKNTLSGSKEPISSSMPPDQGFAKRRSIIQWKKMLLGMKE